MAELRLGVLLGPAPVSRWVARALDQLPVPPVAVFEAPEAQQRGPGRLYRAWRRAEARVFPALGEDAWQPVHREAVLAGLPRVPVTWDGEALSAASLAAIEDAELDLLLCPQIELSGPVHALVETWAVRFGAPGAPPGFWEVARWDEVTRVAIVRADTIIARSLVHTLPLSVNRHASSLGHKAGQLLVQTVSDRLAGIQRPEEAGETEPAPPPRAPEMARIALRMGLRSARELGTRKLGYRQWVLGHTARDPAEGPPTDWRPMQVVVPPKWTFWADPFPVHHQGRDWVLVEEFDWRGPGRGVLAALRPDGERWVKEGVLLERDVHLSWPNAFFHDGDWWLLPESSGAGTLDLYRAVDFPLRWEHVDTWFSGMPIADPVLVEHGGRWWLFAAVGAPGTAPLEQLWAWHGPSPLGPWTPHAANPLVSDATRARPGGRFVHHQGRLLRVAQEAGREYGVATRLTEVVQLDTRGFTEVDVARIGPNWRRGLRRTHTLNGDRGVWWVDGLLVQPRWGAPREPSVPRA